MTRLLAAAFVVLACSRATSAETPPPERFDQVIRGTATVALIEGLPHPGAEPDAFATESAKPHRKIADQAFYEGTLSLTAKDTEALRALLGEPTALARWSGEKKCGGFHADYALEVEKAGVTWRALICFGCGEVRVIGGSLDRRYDMTRPTKTALEALLGTYRKNRPPRT